MYLLFDFETSDLYKNNLAPSDKKQAWPVQIGALYLDKHLNITKELGSLIKPPYSDSVMAPKAFETHNIKIENCIKKGITNKKVQEFLEPAFSGNIDRVIGHNIQFDLKFLNTFVTKLSIAAEIERLAKTAVCTMRRSTSVCKMPPTENMKPYKFLRYKSPKLEELYLFLFGKPFIGAHDALADAYATLDCFRELVKRKIIIL